jgi:hypothetical protein
MNGVTELRGLSARQKTRKTSRQFGIPAACMLAALALIISSCQTGGQDSKKSKEKFAATDSLHKPQVNIQVNRHYDGKGNVIGFDSTYSSFYSNVEGDTMRMDSLINSFDNHFGIGQNSFFNNSIDSLFFKNKLRYPDFFHNDFFLKRYEVNDGYFRDMMRRMDSVKNNFYQQHSKRGGNDKSKDL